MSNPPIAQGRQIIHFNNSGIDLDLYLTIGAVGQTPQKLATLTTRSGSNSYTYDIPNSYNWVGNFNVLPAGDHIPNDNAGPTLAEFGLNQIWPGATPPLRDTFDISTVPAGIGNLLCNDGQACRNKAVMLSLGTGKYSQQQAYNYNVGCRIVPPSGTAIPNGSLQSPICTNTLGYPAYSIGYPLDTAVPKQQTGSAMVGVAGNYHVYWIPPVVPLNPKSTIEI